MKAGDTITDRNGRGWLVVDFAHIDRDHLLDSLSSAPDDCPPVHQPVVVARMQLKNRAHVKREETKS